MFQRLEILNILEIVELNNLSGSDNFGKGRQEPEILEKRGWAGVPSKGTRAPKDSVFCIKRFQNCQRKGRVGGVCVGGYGGGGGVCQSLPEIRPY